MKLEKLQPQILIILFIDSMLFDFSKFDSLQSDIAKLTWSPMSANQRRCWTKMFQMFLVLVSALIWAVPSMFFSKHWLTLIGPLESLAPRCQVQQYVEVSPGVKPGEIGDGPDYVIEVSSEIHFSFILSGANRQDSKRSS